MSHKHEYRWRTVGVVPPWRVFAECHCGDVAWSHEVSTSGELNATLTDSFKDEGISPLGYFTAPTHVPFEALALQSQEAGE